MAVFKINLNFNFCKLIKKWFDIINMICSLTECDTAIKRKLARLQNSSRILNMTYESKNGAPVKPNRGSTLYWCFGLNATKAVLCLLKSLIGICQYTLYI